LTPEIEMYESVTTDLKERNTNPVPTPREVLGLRSETIRRANLSAIVRELHEHGPLSRSDLVARTGLTRSAIRGLIGEFVGAGLVTERRSASDGQPGRPSPLVGIDPRGAVVLALEIAVDSLAAALVGLGGEMLEHRRVDRPRGHFSVEETVADLVELASSLGWPDRVRGLPIGIGVAVVGVVRRSDGLVSIAPNLGWRDAPLGEQLDGAFGDAVPVRLANDADLGALAEHRRGAARGHQHVLFISGEVGVGAGLIAGGQPLAGAAGFAGEVGHLRVNPNGAACRCGSVGCWETEVGEGALLMRAGRPPGGGRGEVDELLADAASGSPAVLRAVDDVGRWLGVGLASLVNVLNPELIVLGGLFGRLHPFVARTVNAELERFALAAPRGMVEIVPASLGIDAPLLGAAELAFEPFLADPAHWFRTDSGIRDLASA
jgi:predicted NBD/HSP70 family sugar kinase